MAKATAATKATTPNASSNSSRHRKPSPSHHLRNPSGPGVSQRLGGRVHRHDRPTASMDSQSPSTSSSVSSDPGSRRRVRTAAHRFYCAVHGFNTTHNGHECRPVCVSVFLFFFVIVSVFVEDPSTYTNQHLQAKKPSDCTNPAGNDNVQALRPRLH
jgi:hypothetical protein